MKVPGIVIRIGRSLRSGNKAPFLVALMIFIATLAAYLYYWGNLRTNVQNDMNAAYTRQVRLLSTNMTTRFQLYETLLRGGAGLFTLNGNQISRENWSQYFQPYEISENYPDIRGIAFSRYVTNAELPAFIDERKAEDPAYAVNPEGPRDAYVPLVFIARYTGAAMSVIGYDGFSEPVRRDAMLRAAESGNPALSGRIDLRDEDDRQKSAFIIYLPVYKPNMPLTTETERRNALYGFSYMSIDAANLFKDLQDQNNNPHFAFRVVDPEYRKTHPKAAPAYQSEAFAAIMDKNDSTVGTSKVMLYGREYEMTFAGSSKLISDAERQVPTQALLRGIFSSMLFAAIVWYLITFRERKLNHWKQQEVQTAKDDLLSLASHQLRTPATVVKQYVGMLLQGYGGEVTEQQKEMLASAYDSNERQLEIINQLLYVARLDAGRITLRKEAVDLPKLIRSVVSDQKQAAEDRRQTVKAADLPVDLSVQADPRYLRMVLENLLSNAIKYTPEGGSVTLAASLHGDAVCISVTDTGVGMNQSQIARIFDKFTRVENVLSTDVNGSGVGLYLTKEIITLHDGTIDVESETGKGATFTVTLPRGDV